MQHLHITSRSPRRCPLPLCIQLTDLGNNQICPFPEQKTSPKQVSVLTPNKQEPEGDEEAHTDTAWPCCANTTAQTGLSTGPLPVSVLFICSLPDMVLPYADSFQVTPKCCTEESKYQGLFPDKNTPGLAPCRLQSPLTPGCRASSQRVTVSLITLCKLRSGRL